MAWGIVKIPHDIIIWPYSGAGGNRRRSNAVSALRTHADNSLDTAEYWRFLSFGKILFFVLCKIVKGFRHRLVNVRQKLRNCKFSMNCIEKRNWLCYDSTWIKGVPDDPLSSPRMRCGKMIGLSYGIWKIDKERNMNHETCIIYCILCYDRSVYVCSDHLR